jgi:hypothetical protein
MMIHDHHRAFLRNAHAVTDPMTGWLIGHFPFLISKFPFFEKLGACFLHQLELTQIGQRKLGYKMENKK